MRLNESADGNSVDAKERIRQRYRGVDPNELEVIPALPKDNIFKETKTRIHIIMLTTLYCISFMELT